MLVGGAVEGYQEPDHEPREQPDSRQVVFHADEREAVGEQHGTGWDTGLSRDYRVLIQYVGIVGQFLTFVAPKPPLLALSALSSLPVVLAD